jgi:hypothetical protein
MTGTSTRPANVQGAKRGAMASPLSADFDPAPPTTPRPELWRRVPRKFFHLRAALGDRAAQRRVDREPIP